MKTQKWMTDTQLVETLGERWTDDMELPNDDTMEMNVESANVWLKEHNIPLTMLGCRDIGDELEWLVEAVVID